MEKHSFLYSIVILIFQNFGVSINFEKEQKCQKLKKKNPKPNTCIQIKRWIFYNSNSIKIILLECFSKPFVQLYAKSTECTIN